MRDLNEKLTGNCTIDRFEATTLRMGAHWKKALLSCLILVCWQFSHSQIPDTILIRRQLNAAEERLQDGDFNETTTAVQQALRQMPAGYDLPVEAEARWLLGEAALGRGNYEEALFQFDTTYCLLQDYGGAQHPMQATALSHLGNYYFELGHLQAAYEHHVQGLALRLQHYGENDPETAKSYNNLANCYFAGGQYDQAIDLYKLVLRIRREAGAPPADLASAFNNLANALLSRGQLQEAHVSYRRALDIRRKEFGPEHLKTAQSCQNLGSSFAALHQPDSALWYFEAALGPYTRHYGENHHKTAALYENMGNALADQQAFQAAGALLERALQIRAAHYGPGHPDVIRAYQNTGELWLLRGDYQAALGYFRQAFYHLKEQWGDRHPQLAQAYEQMGMALLNMEEFNQAEEYLLQALSMRQALFGIDHPYVAGTALNLGNLAWQAGDFAEARSYYNLSLSIWIKQDAGWNPEQGKAWLNIGHTHLEEGEPSLAVEAFNRARPYLPISDYRRSMAQAYTGLGKYDPAETMLVQALSDLGYSDGLEPASEIPLEIIQCIQARADNALARARTSNDVEGLEQALQWYEKAIEYWQTRQTGYFTPEARQRLAALNQSLFAGAVEACLELAGQSARPEKFYRKAFSLSEHNKSLRLLEAEWLRRSADNRRADSIVTALQECIFQINQVEKEIGRRSGPHRSLDDELFALQAERRRLHSRLEAIENVQSTSESKLDESGIDRLQAALAPDEALLSFFQAGSKFYAFAVLQDKVYACRLAADFPWQEAIAELGNSLLEYADAPSGQRTGWDSIYTNRARALHDSLFVSLDSILVDVEQLTIVPDGALGWLPFEALLSETPAQAQRYRAYPYLIQRYTISYAFAAGHWLQQRDFPTTRPARRACLALAPDFTDRRQGFAPLDYNLPEAQSISRMLGGKVLSGASATRERFLSLAPEYAILHLATHAKANLHNGDYSFMVFSRNSADTTSDNLLYVKDLYGIDWAAELAVLSACETGIGAFRPGEGVVSLGRGFVQAGIRSVVNSLWAINDARTAQLMEAFYKNLQSRDPKNSALRQAKLDYLATVPHEAAHPFYWAGYHAYGDMAPLQLPQRTWHWLLLPLLFFGAVIIIIWTQFFPSKLNERPTE
jgi:CHAT domain-containing protein/Tfp pilus assembly protein PilF